MNELEIFNDITVGRELKMLELKKEINELLKRMGKKKNMKSWNEDSSSQEQADACEGGLETE